MESDDRLDDRRPGLDSAIFVTIAFAGTGVELGETIITTWLIKVAWEAAAAPLTYVVVNQLKQREGVDVYDYPPGDARPTATAGRRGRFLARPRRGGRCAARSRRRS